MDADEARKNHDPLEAPPRIYTIDPTYLEMGRVWFQASNQLILNPRNVAETSLALADMDWYHELNRYIAEFDYQVDVIRREKGLD